jgi:hypothetical protein
MLLQIRLIVLHGGGVVMDRYRSSIGENADDAGDGHEPPSPLPTAFVSITLSFGVDRE